MTDHEIIAVPEPALLASVPPLSQHPVAVYLAGLAPGSRRAMRDALRIIALSYACGLRRAEIVALDLASYDRAAGTLICAPRA